MAIIIVVFANMAWLQTQLLVLKTALVLCYVGSVWPFDRAINNRLELANELCILLNTYFLIVYSDFVHSAEARYKMGWVNLAILIIQVLISGGIVLANQGHAVYRGIKLKYLKRKSQKRSKQYAL